MQLWVAHDHSPQGLSCQYFWMQCCSWQQESNKKWMATHIHTFQTVDCDLPYCSSWNTWKKLTVINNLAAASTLADQEKSRNTALKFCIPTQIFETCVTQTNQATLFPARLDIPLLVSLTVPQAHSPSHPPNLVCQTYFSTGSFRSVSPGPGV